MKFYFVNIIALPDFHRPMEYDYRNYGGFAGRAINYPEVSPSTELSWCGFDCLAIF